MGESSPEMYKETGNREDIARRLESIKLGLEQIEKLYTVPSGVNNLGEGLAQRISTSALEQDIATGQNFWEKLKKLDMDALEALTILRNATGVSTREEALKFVAGKRVE